MTTPTKTITFERDGTKWTLSCWEWSKSDIVRRDATEADLRAAGYSPSSELARLAERFDALRADALLLLEAVPDDKHCSVRVRDAKARILGTPPASAPTEAKDELMPQERVAVLRVWGELKARATQAEARVAELVDETTEVRRVIARLLGTEMPLRAGVSMDTVLGNLTGTFREAQGTNESLNMRLMNAQLEKVVHLKEARAKWTDIGKATYYGDGEIEALHELVGMLLAHLESRPTVAQEVARIAEAAHLEAQREQRHRAAASTLWLLAEAAREVSNGK